MTTAPTSAPVVRESGLVAGICWVLDTWSFGFTLDLIARADDVTSAQWRYLMSVPGGNLAWAGVFLSGALALVYGLAVVNYRLRAIGCGLIGFGCSAIAAFYVFAPLIDPGLTTLGYWPWLLGGLILILAALVNAKPLTWF